MRCLAAGVQFAPRDAAFLCTGPVVHKLDGWSPEFTDWVTLLWSLIINLENDYLFITVACGGATHTYSESTDR